MNQELINVVEDIKFHIRMGEPYMARRVLKAFGKKSPYPIPREWADFVRFVSYLAVIGDKRE